jgi:hypothetical protein
MLATTEGAVKKVLASLEMCWRSKKELLKKVLASLEKCLHLQKRQLKKCWQP